MSEKFNVSESTVWRWYKNLNWNDRENKRKHEILMELERKNIENVVDFKVRALGITGNLIEVFIGNIRRLRITSMRDLDMVIKLHLLLLEQPTEIRQDMMPLDSGARLERLKKIEELHNK